MNITHDEDRFGKWEKDVLDLAKVIDDHAFQVSNYVDEVGKDFHLPVNIYWRERRAKANLLAEKILNSGYKKI